MRNITGIWLASARCEKGNAAIEFAVVLPILLLFIFGITEFGFILFESATLQGALSAAAREGATGYPDINDPGNQCIGGICKTDPQGNILNYGPRWLKVKSILLGQTQSIFNQANLTFSATAYPDFVTLEKSVKGQPGFKGTKDDVGGSGQVVVYTASYPAPTYLQRMFGIAPTGSITAHIIVKNEGF